MQPTSVEPKANRDWPIIPGYQLESVIGRGGMGRVFRARDERLGRIVAIKCLLHAGDDQLIKRFVVEARAAAQLQHPNIAQLYEFHLDAEQHFFVMEYVGGGTLSKLMNGRPIEPTVAAKLISVLARAIAYAHGKGIIHRDLKPGNILIYDAPLVLSAGAQPNSLGSQHDTATESTQPARKEPSTPSAYSTRKSLDQNFDSARLRIADFGLARNLVTEDRLTRTGEILGTPEYMSPEQATGIQSRIGPSTDVYSLGAILYELLTGRPPFVGPDGIQTVLMLLSNDPIAPRAIVSRLPLDVQTICLKSLEKRPARRYSSAIELAEDLERFVRGEPIRARPISTLSRMAKWTLRKPWQAVALGLLVISVIGAAVGLLMLQAANRKVRLANQDLTNTNNALTNANRQAGAAFKLSQDALSGIAQKLRDELYDIPQVERLAVEATRESVALNRRLLELRPDDLYSAAQLARSLDNLRYSEWLQGNRGSYYQLSAELLELVSRLRQQQPEAVEFATLQLKLWMDAADDPEFVSPDLPAEIESTITTRLSEVLREGPKHPQVFKVASEQSLRMVNRAVADGDLESVLGAARVGVNYSREYVRAIGDGDRVPATTWLIQWLVRIARFEILAKNYHECAAAIQEAENLVAELTKSNSMPRTVRGFDASLSACGGQLAAAQESWKEAAEKFGVANDKYARLIEAYPQDSNLRSNLIEVLVEQAKVAIALANPNAAKAHLDDAEKNVAAVLKDLPDDWFANDVKSKIERLRSAATAAGQPGQQEPSENDK